MRKISDALREAVLANAFLRFGLTEGVFNLSQLARLLHPLVEARVRKEVQLSALTMALSRLSRELEGGKSSPKEFRFQNLNLQSGLATVSFFKNPQTRSLVHQFFRKKTKHHDSHCFLSEGNVELTVICPEADREALLEMVGEKPRFMKRGITALSIQFDPAYLEQSGFLFSVLQQLALQGINLIEIASTATEFLLYLEERDVRLAFDTLYNSFSQG